jgi:hypothetical protein
VVAPDSNRSAHPPAIPGSAPVRAQAANGFYFVNGTPTDCVHVALTACSSSVPICGFRINGPGAMGDDTQKPWWRPWKAICSAFLPSLFPRRSLLANLMGHPRSQRNR